MTNDQECRLSAYIQMLADDIPLNETQKADYEGLTQQWEDENEHLPMYRPFN